ncbi:MAG: DUF488 domain-containing protein [Proteobacteria bacterium]|nr:DUF488 domain-containing protein [Burkholderiales bacterium]
MKLFTIGFTRKTAERFFGLLGRSGATRIVDVRLHNMSQLAGFAKRDDLAYFARSLCTIDYVHLPELAPTPDLLDAYRKRAAGWTAYEHGFIELMRERRIEHTVPRSLLDGACLLCSEHAPHHCHRRLIAEYLDRQWGGIRIEHLV